MEIRLQAMGVGLGEGSPQLRPSRAPGMWVSPFCGVWDALAKGTGWGLAWAMALPSPSRCPVPSLESPLAASREPWAAARLSAPPLTRAGRQPEGAAHAAVPTHLTY